jgi:peptide/nickel transport system permease protein
VFTYISRRIAASVPVLLIASFIVYWAVRLTFDPTVGLRTSRKAAQIVAARRKELGLDKPIVVQYWNWLKGFVHGDWGVSSHTGDSVFSMVRAAFGNTLQLIVWGALISAVIAILLGVYSAVRQYSVSDYVFTGLSYVGLAMPPFWFALVAIELLAVGPKNMFHLDKPWFYFVGLHSNAGEGFDLDYLKHLALPVMTLTVQIIASWSRFERAAMLDVLNSDYVRTARAKGLRPSKVIFRHAFRNALIPLVTVIAIDAGALFGGLIITEFIFSVPGMGRLFITALTSGDVNVVLAWMLVSALFVIVFNLVADVLYGVLDPRIRMA